MTAANPKFPFVAGLAALGLILLMNCVFIVDQTEQAIILRMGSPRAVITKPGLKFKLPAPIETTVIFEKRILDVDPPAEVVNILADKYAERTSQQKAADEAAAILPSQTQGMPITVDTFARYRIIDPLKFLERLRSEQNAAVRISNVMNNATRDVLSTITLNDLLSKDRTVLMRRIRDQVNGELKQQGVEMVDIRIVRADLTSDLLTFTVNRMITQQKEQATKTRSSGQEQAIEIRSTAEKERSVLLADAAAKAQSLRGAGDNEAIGVYSAAFNQDPEFYRFLRTMEAYKTTFDPATTQFVIAPSGDFLGHLKTNR